jgi:hypothetical protein
LSGVWIKPLFEIEQSVRRFLLAENLHQLHIVVLGVAHDQAVFKVVYSSEVRSQLSSRQA